MQTEKNSNRQKKNTKLLTTFLQHLQLCLLKPKRRKKYLHNRSSLIRRIFTKRYQNSIFKKGRGIDDSIFLHFLFCCLNDGQNIYRIDTHI